MRYPVPEDCAPSILPESPTMSVLRVRRSYHSLLHAPHLAPPPRSHTLSPLPHPAARHILSPLLLSLASAIPADLSSRSPSTAAPSSSLSPPAPCILAASPPDTPSFHLHLFLHHLPRTPLTASLLARPPEPPPPPASPSHAGSFPLPPPLVRSGILLSLPGYLSVPRTLCSHPPHASLDPRSCTHVSLLH